MYSTIRETTLQGEKGGKAASSPTAGGGAFRPQRSREGFAVIHRALLHLPLEALVSL